MEEAAEEIGTEAKATLPTIFFIRVRTQISSPVTTIVMRITAKTADITDITVITTAEAAGAADMITGMADTEAGTAAAEILAAVAVILVAVAEIPAVVAAGIKPAVLNSRLHPKRANIMNKNVFHLKSSFVDDKHAAKNKVTEKQTGGSIPGLDISVEPSGLKC